VRQSGTVVFQMGDQRQNATNPDEQSFTQALLKLENPTAPKVYFTTGHGERDTNAVDEAGYNSALLLLQKQNFQVDNLNLLTSSKVPDDAAVLVIAAPTKPFADAEKQAVQDYLGKGGALLLLIDLQTDHQVADYVAPWKVQVQWQPIIDPASSLPGDPLTPVVDTYINHAITKNLDRKFTVWPSTAALVFPKDPPAEGDFVAPLAESSARSWMESDFDAEVKAGRLTFDQGKDTVGPITIAGVIEANAAQQPPKDPQHPEQQPKKTRVVVVADADFLSNQLLRLQTFNPDFLLNTMNWLGASEQLISIPPKDPANNTIVLTGTQANTITLTTVVILPLLVLAAGAFVWWSRR
jgi:ABC-type uncharacterized transport system involved in gliding motility auxiliary subunit